MDEHVVDPVKAAKEFIAQRDEHRRALLDALRDARAAVSEIETTLRELGVATNDEAEPETNQRSAHHRNGATTLNGKLTWPEVIRGVVGEHPGLTSGEIVAEVRKVRTKASATVLFPTIYRMQDDGRLDCSTGRKRGGTYTLPSGGES
jgi:hypothetical protein